MVRIRWDVAELIQTVDRCSERFLWIWPGHTELLAIYHFGHCERPLVIALPLSELENAHHTALLTYRLRENDATGLVNIISLVVLQDTVDRLRSEYQKIWPQWVGGKRRLA
jgi:hypothetical protein